jgi:hypothetical protein
MVTICTSLSLILLTFLGKRGPLEQKMHQIIKDGDYNNKHAPPLPTYFRKLHDEGVVDCSNFLKSNLVLDGGYQKASLGDCKDRFLCAWIDTEGLPWDSRAIIW